METDINMIQKLIKYKNLNEFWRFINLIERFY